MAESKTETKDETTTVENNDMEFVGEFQTFDKDKLGSNSNGYAEKLLFR